MNALIITTCIYISFYVISGYSTTDIIRLSNASTANISNSSCFCPVCGKKYGCCIKFVFLFTHGTREAEFGKNLICSLLNNIVLWAFIAFLFGLRAIIQSNF